MKRRIVALALVLLLCVCATEGALASVCAICGGSGKVTCSWCKGAGGKYTAYDVVWSYCS